jgi:hypothetical protein
MSDAGSDTEGREEGPVLGVHYSDLKYRLTLEIVMSRKKDMGRERMNFQMEMFIKEITLMVKDLVRVFINGKMVRDTLGIMRII